VKIYPKKSLGQNFLIDQSIIEKIVNTTEIKDKEVLEVGPGTGNLTEKIIQNQPSKVFVVEKDDSLCQFLRDKFNDDIEIINKDILSIDEDKISKNLLIVFGNLPYNISTEILLKWILNLKSKIWFHELILMFQKEVADRIIAEMNTSNYGRLSIISQWKFDIKKITDIKADCFNPKPKIESSLLHFFPKKVLIDLNLNDLELITRVFFNHRRKMIKKPIYQLFKDPILISKKFNIDLTLRPQNISSKTYYELAREYKSLRR
tara:strand:- start:122 stop:907 length:786 start_codon:yes stop_codon:yes gene_type:complete